VHTPLTEDGAPVEEGVPPDPQDDDPEPDPQDDDPEPDPQDDDGGAELVWHTGFVGTIGDMFAEIRGIHFLAGSAALCLSNVDGFAKLARDFRVEVTLGESQIAEGVPIVTRLKIIGDQLREELSRLPIARWTVEQVASWVGVLDMEPEAATVVQAAITDGRIDGEQLVALKIDLLCAVLCQPGRLGVEHDSRGAATGSICTIPQMIVAERDQMRKEQLRQHAGGGMPLGERLPFDEDMTHEFKDYSSSRITKAVRNPKGILRYVTAFLNSGEGGSLLFGVTDDGYVRGVRLDRNERDDLKKAIDAALRPIEKHGMIVGPEPRFELNGGPYKHYRLNMIPVTGRGGTPLCGPHGDPVVFVIEVEVMPAMGNSGWHRDATTPAPKWCVKVSSVVEECIYYIKQSASVSRHRISSPTAARAICRGGLGAMTELEEDSDSDSDSQTQQIAPQANPVLQQNAPQVNPVLQQMVETAQFALKNGQRNNAGAVNTAFRQIHRCTFGEKRASLGLPAKIKLRQYMIAEQKLEKLVATATHRHWKGTLHFCRYGTLFVEKDGKSKNLSKNPGNLGRWECSGGRLSMCWHKWPHEHLNQCQQPSRFALRKKQGQKPWVDVRFGNSWPQFSSWISVEPEPEPMEPEPEPEPEPMEPEPMEPEPEPELMDPMTADQRATDTVQL